jgi:uncharacterized protein (TIGR02231 family)
MDEPKAIGAPVVEVSLLEDRAHVIRRGAAAFSAGRHKVRVADVAPVASDKTLTVHIRAPESAARVTDARVRRRAVVRLRDEDKDEATSELSELEEKLRQLDRKIDRQKAKRTLIEKHAAGLEEIALLTLDDLAGDASWGREIGKEYEERLEKVREEERELRMKLCDSSGDIEELEEKRERLRLRLQTLEKPSEREWAAVDAELQVETAGEYVIQIDYVVPGACWRPWHTARLADGESPKVIFNTDACVWQNTGEDWTDAELVFSTERASLGTEPPELTSDILRKKKKSEAVEVEARQQRIQTTGLGTDAVPVSPELPGIDDGGQILNLRAASRSTVPSDGRPYRIELARFESAAKTELTSAPELNPSVILKSTQTNHGPGPILAGPVDLVRDSGFVGRTSVLFIAAGEKFELGWGPDAELRVKRTDKVTQEKSRTLSSWVTRDHDIEVRLSNLSPRPRFVKVTERVPVSEIDKVKIIVADDKTTGGMQPNKDGFVDWTVALKPFGHDTLEIHYTLKKHQDVVGI